VSAPERLQYRADAVGVRSAYCAVDIVEIAALRERRPEILGIAASRGWTLPEIGRSVAASQQLAICVRPERWLLLHPTAANGSHAVVWESAVADNAAVVELSSALTLLRLSGPAVREMLARGCRLDLDPAVFVAGHAAATIMAQVSVILVALSSDMLLVTPSTTARHLSEWIAHTAAPFGFELEREIGLHEI